MGNKYQFSGNWNNDLYKVTAVVDKLLKRLGIPEKQQ